MAIDPDIQHTGEQPSRRPPEDEAERVGEGELDIGPPADAPSDLDEDDTENEHLVREKNPSSITKARENQTVSKSVSTEPEKKSGAKDR